MSQNLPIEATTEPVLSASSVLLGHSPEEWASIITIRMTAEWPQNPQDAEKIYTEIIRAAMDQERWPNIQLADKRG